MKKTKLIERLNAFCNWRYIPVFLFGLGLLRNVILLLAYPPAHGPDSIVYFFYAHHLAHGGGLPNIQYITTPLYPLLIVVTFHWLGSAWWLIGLQWLMAGAIAPLYYLALKPYNPVWALLAALVVLGDAQLAVTFNFTSTESLYVLLLALLAYALLHVAHSRSSQDQTRRSALLASVAGTLLALLLLTRPVGKFLIVAVLLVFGLVTRDWRRMLNIAGGFVITLAFYALMSLLIVGRVEGLSGGVYMLQRPARIEASQTSEPMAPRPGEQASTTESTVIERASEFITRNRDYIERVWGYMLEFLALSAQQYGYDALLPSEVQCGNLDSYINNAVEHTRQSHFAWTLANVDDAIIREVTIQATRALCPTLPHVPAFRELVDYVAFRYRSLGRPRPILWYGGVLVLALLVSQFRKYLPIVLIFGALLLYHALASAAVFNVQPRYVVVTNPFRATLLVGLVVLVVEGAFRLIKYLMKSREA